MILAQVRAIVQAIEIEIAGARDTLATRQDTLILRHEMAQLRTELRQDMGPCGTALSSSSPRPSRQLYAALLGQLALLLGIAYFLVTHLQH